LTVQQRSQRAASEFANGITNWAEYDAALRQRGSLTVWFTEAAVAAWEAEPRTTPGGQPHYSDLAITTALTLKAVFRLESVRDHFVV
jgi:hypothetical protein